MTTRHGFIEKAPLYTQYDSNDFYPPDSVSISCSVCAKETTWGRVKCENLYDTCELGGYIVTYQCGLCSKDSQSLTVFVRKFGSADKPKIQKVGQFPPQAIDIPSDLEKRLGEDAFLYKNALICRNANFGLGSVAYLRRVVENKTNELIEVVAEEAESYEVASEDVAKIRAAKDERHTYDERLQLASDAIPSKLKPDGANPLGALHGLLSEGLHAKTEEQCVAIADEIRDVFEYVFSRLRGEIEDRNKMVNKIKKWVGKKKGE
jgi:hypothetical protein